MRAGAHYPVGVEGRETEIGNSPAPPCEKSA